MNHSLYQRSGQSDHCTVLESGNYIPIMHDCIHKFAIQTCSNNTWWRNRWKNFI